MNPADDHLETALQLFQQGLYDPSEQRAAEAIQCAPGNFTAWHLLGLISFRKKNFQQALERYDRALMVRDDVPELYCNRGIVLHALHHLDDALAAYTRALELRPTYVEALNNTGNVYQELRQFQKAIDAYTAALAIRPDDVQLLNNIGAAHRAMGELQEAARCFQKALSAQPDNADALNNLASVLQMEGNDASVLTQFKQALAQARNPGQRLQAAYNLGVLIQSTKKSPAAAEAAYKQALSIDPGHDLSLINLALLQYEHGQLLGPARLLEEVLNTNANKVLALNNLANIYRDSGRINAAKKLLERAIELDHDLRPFSNLIMTMQYDITASSQELVSKACAWGQRATSKASGNLREKSTKRLHERADGAPLRIGYVSGDFCMHPVGLFLKSVLASHDPLLVIPFLYSNRNQHDLLTDRLRQSALKSGGKFADITSMSDAAFAQQVVADQIDILVDLSGHTAHSRLSAFAARPAPVQISWLGYFATTGLEAMDFVIMDPWHAPKEAERQFCEKVLRLPHNRFCYTAVPFSPSVGSLPHDRNGFISFGCFNNTSKINMKVLQLWGEILQRVPDSKLILKWKTFADPAYRILIGKTFEQLGVSPDRLELRTATAHQKMLGEYNDIDIALDPFPFSGGHTSCEALWMGVPVVTLAGERVVSRQTFSFLKNIGHEELAAFDDPTYVETAVELAKDIPRLRHLRTTLREKMGASPLCQVKPFTRSLEALYHETFGLKKGAIV